MSARLLRGLLLLSRCRVIGVSLLLALVFSLFIYQFLQDRVSFNSDQLYCIHFCDDLLHGRDVQGFHMPAAPYVFPDMALVLLCSVLTSNLTAVFILYSVLYYSLLLAVLTAICRGLGLSRRDSYVTAALGVAFLLAAHFDPAYVGRFVAFLASDEAREITGQLFGVRGRDVVLFSQPRPVAHVELDLEATTDRLADEVRRRLAPAFTPLETDLEAFSHAVS